MESRLMIRLPSKEEKLLYYKASGRKASPCVLIYWPFFWGNWVGFTPGPVIFHSKNISIVKIIHEMVHVRQFYRGWWLWYWISYICQLFFRGYVNISYEVEARTVEEEAETILREMRDHDLEEL